MTDREPTTKIAVIALIPWAPMDGRIAAEERIKAAVESTGAKVVFSRTSGSALRILDTRDDTIHEANPSPEQTAADQERRVNSWRPAPRIEKDRRRR